ncbi:MAG TPA: hypothetical protein VMF32_12425 [Xanthobacteraceae bacterium]|nr:hypothetical protein [Xanthobacteraceae bacterium]
MSSRRFAVVATAICGLWCPRTMPGDLMILLSNSAADIRCAEAASSAIVAATVDGITILRRTDCGWWQKYVTGRA